MLTTMINDNNVSWCPSGPAGPPEVEVSPRPGDGRSGSTAARQRRGDRQGTELEHLASSPGPNRHLTISISVCVTVPPRHPGYSVLHPG